MSLIMRSEFENGFAAIYMCEPVSYGLHWIADSCYDQADGWSEPADHRASERTHKLAKNLFNAMGTATELLVCGSLFIDRAIQALVTPLFLAIAQAFTIYRSEEHLWELAKAPFKLIAFTAFAWGALALNLIANILSIAPLRAPWAAPRGCFFTARDFLRNSNPFFAKVKELVRQQLIEKLSQELLTGNWSEECISRLIEKLSQELLTGNWSEECISRLVVFHLLTCELFPALWPLIRKHVYARVLSAIHEAVEKSSKEEGEKAAEQELLPRKPDELDMDPEAWQRERKQFLASPCSVASSSLEEYKEKLKTSSQSDPASWNQEIVNCYSFDAPWRLLGYSSELRSFPVSPIDLKELNKRRNALGLQIHPDKSQSDKKVSAAINDYCDKVAKWVEPLAQQAPQEPPQEEVEEEKPTDLD